MPFPTLVDAAGNWLKRGYILSLLQRVTKFCDSIQKIILAIRVLDESKLALGCCD